MTTYKFFALIYLECIQIEVKMKVGVTVIATANEDSSHFNGEFILSGTKFIFDLKFTISIEKYKENLEGKKIDFFRKTIRIRLQNVQGRRLKLEDDEWRLFYHLLMNSIINFQSERVLSGNFGGQSGNVLFAEECIINIHSPASIILSRQKFHCYLLDLSLNPNQKQN